MISHGEARELSCHAISLAIHRGVVPEHAIRHLAGVAYLETHYGAGWMGAGIGSNNMGAIQAYDGWTGARFTYTDTHPNPDGTSTPYSVDFRAYPTALDGMVDLVRVMYTARRADVFVMASRGCSYSVSELMRKTGYYEGFGPTQHDRIRNHMLALRRGILFADQACGIVIPVLKLEGAPTGLPKTVRYGDRGDDVRTLQRELGCIAPLAADGIFGRITERALVDYQSRNKLVPDGVCGHITWGALFTDNYVPESL